MTKNEPRDKRASQLIEAAVAEFAEKGFENASMDAIARRAGLTKGGLYHHFGSKDEILLAANSQFMAPIIEMMETANADPSPMAGLRDFLAGYFAYWNERPEYLVCISLILTKSLKDESWWPAMSDYVFEATRFYQSLFDRAVADGEIAPGDNQARATTIMGAVDGLAIYVCMGAAPPPEQIANLLCRTLAGTPLNAEGDQKDA